MTNLGSGFTFLALAYNHEKYIIEHLESIKYLVESYGSSINCKLIINDDCSKDRTVELIDEWLNQNPSLFHAVVKLYNKDNFGTCASVINMLAHVDTPYLKLTACDDVYSFENIFESMVLEDGVAILSGYPLALIGGELSLDKKDIYSIAASDVIYTNRPLIDRFKYLSNNNAPNIFYNHKYLTDERVLSFLKNFDVVEDWPIQIAIAENFPSAKYKQVDKVFVYYRRTLNSTYLVAGNRFYEDKCKAYNYLICKESNILYKYILKSRLLCFNLNNPHFNKILNIAFYKFVLSVIFKFLKINALQKKLDLKLVKHQVHYDFIRGKASVNN